MNYDNPEELVYGWRCNFCIMIIFKERKPIVCIECQSVFKTCQRICVEFVRQFLMHLERNRKFAFPCCGANLISESHSRLRETVIYYYTNIGNPGNEIYPFCTEEGKRKKVQRLHSMANSRGPVFEVDTSLSAWSYTRIRLRYRGLLCGIAHERDGEVYPSRFSLSTAHSALKPARYPTST